MIVVVVIVVYLTPVELHPVPARLLVVGPATPDVQFQFEF